MNRTYAFVVAVFCLFPLVSPASTAEDLRPVVERVRERLTRSFADLETFMSRGAKELAALGIEGADARKVLSETCTANANIIDCAIVNPAGTMILVEPEAYKGHEGVSIKEQAQIRKVLETKKPVLSDLFVPVEGGYSVDLEYPVLSGDGTFLGSLSALLRVDGMVRDAISNEAKDAGCIVWVMQKDGVIVYDPDPNQINRNIFEDDLFKPFDRLLDFAREVAGRESGVGGYGFYAAGLGDPELVKKAAAWDTFSFGGAEWRIIAARIER